MRRVVFIFALLLLAVPGASRAPEHEEGGDRGNGHSHGGPDANGKSRQDRSQNGQYVVTIAGSFQGTAPATFGNAGVSIQANIVAADGSHGQLSASNLKIDGPYFSGSATAAGQQI